MARITLDLLRRRAEHNEGCLSNLKEITLHQQDLERIELVGDACRELEIMYLCNNYIPRIEGLRHLKWLKYLNLAVNNIKVIEGLEGCEALEKLDLTLNFVADMKDIRRLRANPFLEVLHLTGNPCTRTAGYRSFVVHVLPHLAELDGSEIIKSERIAARQEEEDLLEVVDQEALAVRERERIQQEMIAKGIDPYPPRYNEKGERVYGHSAEERLQMLQEQKEAEDRKKREAETPIPGSISAIHKELNQKPKPLTPEEEVSKFGRLLMRNEGRVPFTLREEPGEEEVVVTVQPGKFLSTTLLDVKVETNCIRVWIKGKLLQVPLQTEVAPDSAKVQRATTTGELKITVPLAAHLLALTKSERMREWRRRVQETQEKANAIQAARRQHHSTRDANTNAARIPEAATVNEGTPLPAESKVNKEENAPRVGAATATQHVDVERVPLASGAASSGTTCVPGQHLETMSNDVDSSSDEEEPRARVEDID